MTRGFAVRLATLLAVGAFGAGAALAAATPLLESSHNPKLGVIVVNARGFTLYHLTSEKRGAIECNGACASFWLPVLVTGKSKPVLGKGVNRAKVGTVKRPNGKLQVTYNKFPLYRYYLDRKPGQAKGEAVTYGAGAWYAVSTSGRIVKAAPSTGGGGGGGGGTTTTTGGGGGYGY